jgi:hypothetical protein
MRNYFLHILLLFTLAACKNQTIEKPVWVNATDTLPVPGSRLVFTTPDEKWEATLYTVTQPVRYTTTYQNGKLSLQPAHHSGVSEGSAQLCLSSGNQHFFYTVYLKNVTPLYLYKDYRSPKTVNPDSSLQQQRIVHSIDENRNIVQTNNRYFFEEEITLSPKSGVYRAIKEEPLSAYYVQPGSCTSIPLKALYKKDEKSFSVIAGPLKDKYNNTVADGTQVAFIYSDGVQTYRMETALLNGYAESSIPALPTRNMMLQAKVNETVSEKIQMIPE